MRRFSFLMLAAALCLPVVGCGDKEAATTTPATETEGSDDKKDEAGEGSDDKEEEKTEETAE